METGAGDWRMEDAEAMLMATVGTVSNPQSLIPKKLPLPQTQEDWYDPTLRWTWMVRLRARRRRQLCDRRQWLRLERSRC